MTRFFFLFVCVCCCFVKKCEHSFLSFLSLLMRENNSYLFSRLFTRHLLLKTHLRDCFRIFYHHLFSLVFNTQKKTEHIYTEEEEHKEHKE